MFSFCELQVQFAVLLHGFVPDADVFVIVVSLLVFIFIVNGALVASYIHLKNEIEKGHDVLDFQFEYDSD